MRGCTCQERWINRWVWVLDPQNEIQLERIVVCGTKYPLVFRGELQIIGDRTWPLFMKGQSCEVSPALIELTYWTREMEKGSPLRTAVHRLLKQFLLENGVCDFVFSFLAFPGFQ
jgi:hypothetical protein